MSTSTPTTTDAYGPLDALHDVFGGGVPVLTGAMFLVLVGVVAYAVWGELDYRRSGGATGAGELPGVVDRREILRALHESGDYRAVQLGHIAGWNMSTAHRYGSVWTDAEYDDYATGGYAGHRDIATVSGVDEALATLAGPHEGVYGVEVYGTAHGDYLGSVYDAANYDYLVTKYPNTFVELGDERTGRALWLPLVGTLVPASMLGELVGLLDYPIIDEMACSEFEHARIDEAMSGYARAAILDEVQAKLDEGVGADTEYGLDIDHDDIAEFVDAAHGAGTLDEWINDALYADSGELVTWVHADAEIRTDEVAASLWSDHSSDISSAVAARIRAGVHY